MARLFVTNPNICDQHIPTTHTFRSIQRKYTLHILCQRCMLYRAFAHSSSFYIVTLSFISFFSASFVGHIYFHTYKWKFLKFCSYEVHHTSKAKPSHALIEGHRKIIRENTLWTTFQSLVKIVFGMGTERVCAWCVLCVSVFWPNAKEMFTN